jgi:LysM repeat protein
MEQRTRRSPARWLGPLALIAVVVALAAVVTGVNDDTGGSSTPGSTGTQSKSSSGSGSGTTASKSAKKPAARKTYVVKVGDSLSLISVKTGVALDRLEELNPDVDTQNMIAGQKIRLR